MGPVVIAVALTVFLGQAFCEDVAPTEDKRTDKGISGEKRSLYGIKKWPKGVVPYEFGHGGFYDSEKDLIMQALDEWKLMTCVDFRKAVPSDRRRVKFIKVPGKCEAPLHVGSAPVINVYINAMCRYAKMLQITGSIFGLRESNFHGTQNNNMKDFVMKPYELSYENIRAIYMLYGCAGKLATVCPKYPCPLHGFRGSDCECRCEGKPLKLCCIPPYDPGVSTPRLPPPPPSKPCFPGDGHVLLDNGKLLEIKHLEIGQRILTVKDGRRVFSEVKTFLKRRPSVNATYVTLATDEGNQISLSDDHLLFATTNTSTTMEARLAGLIKPGDYIFSTAQCSRDLCAERVAQVFISYKQGAYVPLTDEGTLVVDGFLASCYTTASHDVAHILMTPFRWFPWLLASEQQDGYSSLIPVIKAIARMVLPKRVLLADENQHILQSLYHSRSEL
ncbi:uncharacterized protein LOC121390766 isoform X2 [Gigantopelta aegis]|uniref:uncharacterized protein LOC121390766 isoform X2 n=1 Tax=Gigantopelta aegis TaxID=1735272 RepID=UPI001B88C5CB|nr:uncharacterized protein LOC121390766 isoform X2 [Gigantopelta aegis]